MSKHYFFIYLIYQRPLSDYFADFTQIWYLCWICIIDAKIIDMFLTKKSGSEKKVLLEYFFNLNKIYSRNISKTFDIIISLHSSHKAFKEIISTLWVNSIVLMTYWL